ncbi:MAG: hypothetical protein EAZ30_12285 [Betaproteobacteria bacterium]|nr:MAG: hypothetical protein EAZ30_12285 [Betaproteobacteria bacterium]
MPATLKPHLSYPEQIALLKSRGLAISDDNAATHALSHYGYYRLAGYSFPLRDVASVPGTAASFKAGATLDMVCQVAEFDKALRLLVLNGIETVEIATRTAIAHRLGRVDQEAHLKPKLLDGKFCNGNPSKHQEWIGKYNKVVADSKEEFVVHHRRAYGGSMPIWVGIELWSFGMLSRFYEGMERRDRAYVANLFGMLDSEVFGSWLRNLSFARNVAAHHSRLWNRTNPEVPRLPDSTRAPKLVHVALPESRKAKTYATLAILRTLLQCCQSDRAWHTKLKSLSHTFPTTPLIGLSAAGFPPDWETLPLWV